MYPAVLLGTIFTLITTLWCCIRPDFPSPYDSKLRIFSTKLNIILWMLITPEAVFYWAMRQWFEAAKVVKDFQNSGWTRRHGLFFLMGGFVLCNRDGKPVKTLSYKHFMRLLTQRAIEFPTLSTLEIQERSNVHPVIGFIALLQAVWFMMHCLSHFIKTGPGLRLPAITPFEAVAATIEISCFFILFFCWKKPLDARYPILIKPNLVRHRRPPSPRDRPRAIDNAFDSIENTLESQGNQRTIQLEYPQRPFMSISKILNSTPFFLLTVLLWLPTAVYDDLDGLVPPEPDEPSDFPDGTLKVPLFYVQRTKFQRIFILPAAVLSLGISLVSLLFLVPSPYHFPSAKAQLVWRVASMTTVVCSASTLAFTILSNIVYFFAWSIGLHKSKWSDNLVILSDIFLGIVFIVLCIGHIPFFIARFMIIVTSIIYLWTEPVEVLLGGSWADHIPHFS